MSRFSRFFLAVFTAATLCSCENLFPDNTETPGCVTLTLLSDDTKTILADDEAILWQNGDRILINGNMYNVVLDSLDSSIARVYNVVEADEYYAAYIYGDICMDEEMIHGGYLWPHQEYVEGSFGQYMNPMVGYGTDTYIKMHNMGSILKIGVAGDYAIRHLSVSGEHTLSGYLKLYVDTIKNGEYDAYITNGAKQTVALDFRGETIWTPGLGYFYFVVAPYPHKHGIVITMEDENGDVYIQNTFNEIIFERAHVKEMEEFSFRKAQDISISVNNVGCNEVSYAIEAEPGAIVLSRIITKEMYEQYKDSYQLDSLFQDIPDACQNHRIADNGVREYSSETYYNPRTGEDITLKEGTDYVILARYGDGIKGVGGMVTSDFTTEKETFSLTFDENFETRSMSISLREDVVGMKYTFMKNLIYSTKKNSLNMSDQDILEEEHITLSGEEIEIAKTTGLHIPLDNVSFSNDDNFCFIFEAETSKGQKCMKTDFRYFTSTEMDHLHWQEITTDATIKCTHPLNNDIMETAGIRVMKADGYDYYMIEDSNRNIFDLLHMCEDYSFQEVFSSHERIIINAKDRKNVHIIFPYTYLPFVRFEDPTYLFPIYLASDYPGTQSGSTFDGNEFRFNMLLFLEEHVLGNYKILFQLKDVTLKLYRDNTVKGGLETESFVKESVKTAW